MRHPLPRLGLLLVCLIVVGITPALAQESVTHTVQPGETLFRIAQNYGLSVDTLAQANGIANTWQIYAGQTLVIPGTSTEAAQPSAPAPAEAAPAAPATPAVHTIQRGETLASIARLYGTTPEQLMQMNNLANPNLIYSGQQLSVTATAPAEAPVEQAALVAAEAAPAAAPSTTHLVQPGEDLAQIANRYGVSWAAIAQANNMLDPNRVYAGQSLIIPAAANTPDLGIVNAPAAPPAPSAAARSILVDLSDQRTYAYENGVLVRNVLSSTGLSATPTVIGNYTVQRKYAAQTMSGPGYYLPDVPYVMYFYAGYALHGTYWHNNFGQPMSHGCVNLPTPEAEWFYNFAEVGTPVTVQY